MTRIYAPSKADAVKHTMARAKLINLLLKNDEVQALFYRWLHRDPALIVILQEANAERLAAYIDELDVTPMVQELAELILHRWQLWPWVVEELMEAYGRFLYANCIRLSRCKKTLEGIEPLAPPARLEFETRPGETVAEAINRLGVALAEFTSLLETPRGNMPYKTALAGNKDGYPVLDQVVYFYRIRVLGRSKRQVAHDAGVDTKTIRYSIAQAERYLNMPTE